eukprot:5032-Heterococcus_DN1.PRE.3
MSADSSSSKRIKVAAEEELRPEALRRIDTLRVILQYVGRGDWLYAGAVSHRWCDLYREVCLAAVRGRKLWKFLGSGPTRVSVFADQLAPTATLYKSTFQSLARLQRACDGDLQLSTGALLSREAGKYADKQTLQWARKQGLPWTGDVCDGATVAGRLSMLKWLHEDQGCPWSMQFVVRAASRNCNITTLNWLCDNGLDSMELDTLLCPDLEDEDDEMGWYDFGLAVYKSVPVLAWLRVQHTGLLTPNAITTLSNDAARENCFDAVRYLRHSYPEYTEACARCACASGNVEMVKYLVASGCSLIGTAPQERAARCSTADILAYLRDAGHGVWDQATLDSLLVEAGKCGQLEPLKWLRARGAQWPNTVCGLGSALGWRCCWPLPTLQYAIENGCPWGDWPVDTCAQFIVQHFAEEVEWGHANGCPCGDHCPARRLCSAQ